MYVVCTLTCTMHVFFKVDVYCKSVPMAAIMAMCIFSIREAKLINLLINDRGGYVFTMCRFFFKVGVSHVTQVKMKLN